MAWPSPSQDYMATQLDLNEHLIDDKAATYILKISGSSMEASGIFDGDEIIVNRADSVKNNDIVVIVLDNEFLIRRLIKHGDNSSIKLHADDPKVAPITITNEMSFRIWGVVKYCIHKIQ